MRLFLDEDLSDVVAQIARNLGLDACSVHEVDRRGLSDDEQFEYAADHEMVMVTRNRDDYLALNAQHQEAGTPNNGLLIVTRALPADQHARIAHTLQRWVETKEEAPESFGSYVVAYLP
jgi:predicted nuclease of predicted toxin-antitoxin system